MSDGRATASQETLEWATEQGIFSQEEINKQMDSGADVGVHLFETTIMWMEENERKSRYPPIQVVRVRSFVAGAARAITGRPPFHRCSP